MAGFIISDLNNKDSCTLKEVMDAFIDCVGKGSPVGDSAWQLIQKPGVEFTEHYKASLKGVIIKGMIDQAEAGHPSDCGDYGQVLCALKNV